MIGAVVGIAMKMSAALREGRYVPFGPFLAGAGIVVMLAGQTRVLGWLGWPDAGRAPMATLRIGLTGGIGSGKSTVAARLVDRGAELIDTDAIARQLTLPGGAAIDAIRAAFGADSSPPTAASTARACARPRSPTPARSAASRRSCIRSSASRSSARPPRRARRSPSSTSRCWSNRAAGAAASTGSGSSIALKATQVERVMARSGWTEAAVRAVLAQQARAPRGAPRPMRSSTTTASASTSSAREVDALWQQTIALVR